MNNYHFILLAPKFSGIEVLLQKINEEHGYKIIDSKEKLMENDNISESKISIYHSINPRKVIKRLNSFSIVYIIKFDISHEELFKKRSNLSYDFMFYYPGFYEPENKGIDDITLKPLKTPYESIMYPNNWNGLVTHEFNFNKDIEDVYQELIDFIQEKSKSKPNFQTKFLNHMIDETFNIIFEMIPSYSSYKTWIKAMLAPLFLE